MTGPGPDATRVVRALRDRGWTLAAAESLTGGLLTATLTEVAGSSAVVRGGLVVYATDLKHRLAAVPVDLLARVGPVHPDVALALAAGARERCGADLGVGLTGVAGPDPQDGIAVGTVFLGCVWPGGHRVERVAVAADAGRARIRDAAVRAACELVLAACAGAPDPFTDGEPRQPGTVGAPE